MKSNRRLTTTLTLAVLVSGAALALPARAQDNPFEKLKSYDFQNRVPVDAIEKQIQQAAGDKAQDAQIEKSLDAVLEDPNATFAGKQETCRLLSLIGSAQSVPDLAKMLTDDKLADTARYALERDADPSAAKALRLALATTQGKTQIGIINSLGDRGDPLAPPVLKPLVASTDTHVSEAAIAALGKIATPASITILRALPASSIPAGHALLRAAFQLSYIDKSGEASRLYESLAKEGRPAIIRAEAIRGLAVKNDLRASAAALAALKSDDPYLQEVGARICGTQGDKAAVDGSIALWPNLSEPIQIILLTALADRHDVLVVPLAQTAIESKSQTLHAPGIRALAVVGGVKAVPRLVEIAQRGEGGDRGVARESLAGMSGPGVEQEILKIARNGNPEERATVMEILAERPTPDAIKVLVESAQGTDAHVAVQALRALAHANNPITYPQILKVLVTTQNEEVRDAAKEAVLTIGPRLEDHGAGALYAVFPEAPAPAKAALYGMLAEIGDDRALDELTRAANSSDPTLKHASFAVLADNWSDTRPIPTLLAIAKATTDLNTRVQALRGVLRLLGQDEKMPAEQKVMLVGQALDIAERPDEKRQALSVLRDCRIPTAVEMSAHLLDNPDVFNDAANTVLFLAGPQKKNNRDLPAVKGPATNAALDKVIQLTKDDNQRAIALKLKES